MDNWRGDDVMFARIYTAIRKLTDCPSSDSIIRDVDIELLIDHNLQQVKPRAKAKRRGVEYEAGFSRLNVSRIARAIGRDRRDAVAPAVRAVFASQLYETRKDGDGRVEFRPRTVDAACAEAYAAFLETHGRFPTEDWWKLGGGPPTTRTLSGKSVTVGDDPPSPQNGLGDNPPTFSEDRGTTPQLSAHEEVEEKKEKNSVSPTPSRSSGSPLDVLHDTDHGMGCVCMDCRKLLDAPTVVEIRRRIVKGEDIPWTHSSGPLGRCP